jgi:hypothetical protein
LVSASTMPLSFSYVVRSPLRFWKPRARSKASAGVAYKHQKVQLNHFELSGDLVATSPPTKCSVQPLEFGWHPTVHWLDMILSVVCSLGCASFLPNYWERCADVCLGPASRILSVCCPCLWWASQLCRIGSRCQSQRFSSAFPGAHQCLECCSGIVCFTMSMACISSHDTTFWQTFWSPRT